MHEIAVLEGELNVNALTRTLHRDGREELVLHRFPKKNLHILRALTYEYDGIGFTRTDGRFRRRSQTEQIQFTKRCASFGLRVLPPLSEERGHIEHLFLDHAEHLDDFLTHANTREAAQCTHELFMDLYKAHRAGIVYGDRWPPNILVVPKQKILNIDFDIEISGRFAREFEAAQITSYVLGSAKEKIIPQLANLLTHPYAKLHLLTLTKFLRGHAKYYDPVKKYGDMENERETLIALIHKATSHRENNRMNFLR